MATVQLLTAINATACNTCQPLLCTPDTAFFIANKHEPLPTLFSNPQRVTTEFRLLGHGRGGLVPAFGDHRIACGIDFTGIVDNCVKHLRSMKPGMKVDARVVAHQMTFEQV